jgi:serine phosphatase RsbU (regulator of sigma subunit)
METLRPPRIETGLATAMRVGEAESGDLSVVLLTPGGALVGVVDGLGHGEEAAAAAKVAVSVLESHPVEPVVSLVRLCHEELRATRGVVVSLASIDAVEGVMTWVGVGNVEGILLRADLQAQPATESLLLRGGVVGGAELPPLSGAVLRIFPGDTLIFATDGIRSGFAAGLTAGIAPQLLANRILRHHTRNTDDALVLAARFLERPA